MTEKLYYRDGYMRETVATVTAIGDGGRVFLDRTVFYPECGGQPGDRGWFGPYEVTDTQKDGDEVAHIFRSTEGLSAGDTFPLVLDWDHRYDFMVKHSAQHLLSSVFFNVLHIGTLAVHLSDDFLTVEVDAPELSEEELLRVEDEANRAIREGHRIWQETVPREKAEALNMRRSIKVPDPEVMLVHIDGLDVIACGGVHASSTSEIGEIAFVATEKIRGRIRTVWKCRRDSVAMRRTDRRILGEISVLLSSPEAEAADAVKALLGKEAELRARVKSLEERLVRNDCARIKPGDRLFITEYALEEVREYLTEKGIEGILCLRTGEKREFLFHGDDEAFRKMKKDLGLRGGGRNGFYQGLWTNDIEEIRKYIGNC